MITPSKFITIDQSILSKSSHLYRTLTRKRSITEAFRSDDNNIPDINEFILAIDLLWLLNKVDIDPETGELLHIGDNTHAS